MGFEELLMEAKAGSKAAKEELYNMYRPGLIHKAVINGKFDEDLFQELCKKLLICIEKVDIDRVKSYLDKKETDLNVPMN